MGTIACCAGSSPLARGLHGAVKARRLEERIIPARAGFTAQAVGWSYPAPDHPRSRGVYAARRIAGDVGKGSSPLARGLQAPPGERVAHPGIIPARAGFTSRATCPRITSTDHPRSRGVYSVLRIRHSITRGSSPLARGLLPVHAHGYQGGGIIPARAGFTALGKTGPFDWADHPRSRGVYRGATYPSIMTPGSSPLARGLPPASTHDRGVRRIIPARAGFTDSDGPGIDEL